MKKKGDIAIKIPASTIKDFKEKHGFTNDKIAEELAIIAKNAIKDLLDKRDSGVKVKKVKASAFRSRSSSFKKAADRLVKTHAVECKSALRKLALDKDKSNIRLKVKTANAAIKRYSLEIMKCSFKMGILQAIGKNKQVNYCMLNERRLCFFDKIDRQLEKIGVLYEGK